MADIKQIQFKRTKVKGQRPDPSVLAEGELALNLKDRTIFTKDDQGVVVDLGFARGGQIDGDVTQIGNLDIIGNITHKGNYTQTGDSTTTGKVKAENIDVNLILTARQLTARAATSGQGDFVLVNADGMVNDLSIIAFGHTANNTDEFIFRSAKKADPSKYSDVINIGIPPDLTTPTNITFNAKLNVNGDTRVGKLTAGETLIENANLTVKSNGLAIRLKYDNNNSGYIRGEVNDVAKWYLGATDVGDNVSFTNAVNGAGVNLTPQSTVSMSGQVVANNGLGIGTVSAMGDKSIALGDSDTGFKWLQDGYFYATANGVQTTQFGPDSTVFKKPVYAEFDNAANYVNQAQLVVTTAVDGNASGDGQSHFGYRDAQGNFNHYLRGKGITYIATWGGLQVERDSAFYKGLQSLDRISFEQKPFGSYDITSVAKDGPYNLLRKVRANSTGTVFHEVAGFDELAWWSGPTSADVKLFAVGLGGIKVGDSTVASNGNILGSAFANGNLKLELNSKYQAGSSIDASSVGINAAHRQHLWFSDSPGVTNAVIYVDSVNNPQGTYPGGVYIQPAGGNAVVFQPNNSGLKFLSQVNGGGNAMVRGVTEPGLHANWKDRSAAIMLDCPQAAGTAYNVFKAVLEGNDYFAGMDVHFAGGAQEGSIVRILAGQQAFRFEGTGIATAVQFTATGHLESKGGATIKYDVDAGNILIRSDRRLKRNLVKIDSALDKVCSLTGYTYDKKTSLDTDEYDTTEAGLVAQELNQVLPEAVSTTKDSNGNEILSVSPSATIALLVESIKELRDEIAELKKGA